MFEISWGELAVVTGVGLALIGRKDLPRVAYVAGTQVGRIVGLLQGARARADRFAQHDELRHLSNEFRSGLRELDAVRSELAVSMSTTSPIGSGLVSRQHVGTTLTPRRPLQLPLGVSGYSDTVSPSISPASLAETSDRDDAISSTSMGDLTPRPPHSSTVFQTTAAVAEHEWGNRGMAFTSAAEQGRGVANSSYRHDQAGSVILANLFQQSLMFDQYDRVVAEQDAILQSKVSLFQAKHRQQQQPNQPSSSDTPSTFTERMDGGDTDTKKS